MKTTAEAPKLMTEYADFKAYMLGLIDLVLSKPDELINLGEWADMSEDQVIEANDTHKCGSAACLGGYLPEYDPERFEWTMYGIPTAIHDHKFIRAITGSGDHDIFFGIFHANNSPIPVDNRPSDRDIIEKRRQFIKHAETFNELEEFILDLRDVF